MTIPDTMKAVVVTELGGPEVLEYGDNPVPRPAEGEVLVKMEAIGVNYAEIQQRKHGHGNTPPFILGRDGCGEVMALGPGVAGISEGERVAFRATVSGCYAEYSIAKANGIWRVPYDVSSELAAALQVAGMTAHYLTHDVYAVGPGDTCLVHAGAGGVGHLLIQIAKAKGARVLTTVGTEEKAEIARNYGADEVIFYDTEDLPARVAELTGGKGCNVVYDAVGKTTIEDSIKCAGLQGTVANFGDASGPTPPIEPRWLIGNAVYFTRLMLNSFVPDTDAIAKRCGDLVDMIRAGTLEFMMAPTRPLSEAAQAHADLEGRKTVGKLILRP